MTLSSQQESASTSVMIFLQKTLVLRPFYRRHEEFLRNAGIAALLFVGADAVAQYVEEKTRNDPASIVSTRIRRRSSIESDQNGGDYQRRDLLITQHDATLPNQAEWKLDAWRCVGATLLGIALGGAVYPAAYAQLDRWMPGRSWRTILIKSALEIASVGVAVNSASLVGRASWQGTHSWQAVATHLVHEIPHVTFMDAHVWFPYNVVAFGVIPIQIIVIKIMNKKEKKEKSTKDWLFWKPPRRQKRRKQRKTKSGIEEITIFRHV